MLHFNHEYGPLPDRVVIDRHTPTGISIYGYTAQMMRDYAKAEVEKAIAAERVIYTHTNAV